MALIFIVQIYISLLCYLFAPTPATNFPGLAASGEREEPMEHGIWEWAAFGVFVLGMLALDLGVFHRRDHVIRPREALGWSAFWVALALGFGGYVWWRYGPGTAARKPSSRGRGVARV